MAVINERFDWFIALVAGIEVDVDNLLTEVGGGGVAGHTRRPKDHLGQR